VKTIIDKQCLAFELKTRPSWKVLLYYFVATGIKLKKKVIYLHSNF